MVAEGRVKGVGQTKGSVERHPALARDVDAMFSDVYEGPDWLRKSGRDEINPEPVAGQPHAVSCWH